MVRCGEARTDVARIHGDHDLPQNAVLESCAEERGLKVRVVAAGSRVRVDAVLIVASGIGVREEVGAVWRELGNLVDEILLF